MKYGAHHIEFATSRHLSNRLSHSVVSLIKSIEAYKRSDDPDIDISASFRLSLKRQRVAIEPQRALVVAGSLQTIGKSGGSPRL